MIKRHPASLEQAAGVDIRAGGDAPAAGVGFAAERDGGVLIITFNRPNYGNSLTSAAIPQLTELFTHAARDRTIGAVLIRGEGRMFSAGGDVGGFLQTLEQPPDDRRANYHARLDRVKLLIETFVALPLPIVAACQGAVAGAGMTYALGADLVLADDTVKFAFVHQRIGLTPDGGVSVLLPRVVGERKAMELMLTCATIDAAEALRLGLVSRLVPAEALQSDSLVAARRFAAGPRNVVQRTKALLRGAAQRSVRAQLEAERDAVVMSVGESDFEEGVRAFLAKRKAVFASPG